MLISLSQHDLVIIIFAFSQADMPSGFPLREITLTGSPDAIATARHEIALLVNPGSVPAEELAGDPDLEL